MRWIIAALIITALIFTPLVCEAPERVKVEAYGYYPTMKDGWRFTITPKIIK